VSAIYDLFGTGRTAARASYALYFAQGVGTSGVRSNTGALNLTFGFPSGANTSRWNDANGDRIVQTDELSGTPPPPNRYNPATGQLDPNVNETDPNLKNDRTREFVVGVEHELMRNVGLSIDYIWRKYDRGTRNNIIGGVFPPSDVYVGPFDYTDPVSGQTGTYWEVCQTCARQQGPTITQNTPNYTTFSGVEISAEKRFSQRWRAATSVTVSDAKDYTFEGGYADPTNRDKTHGYDGGNSNIRYVFKMLGQVALPWDINASANLNVQDGFIRTIVITGPSGRFGGLNPNGTPSVLPGQPNLELYTRGTNRLPGFTELDLGFARPFNFRGGRNQVTVKVEVFNTLNINTIRGLQNNMSNVNFDRVTAIVPPRVVRLGALFKF
jgi:hypothetical protein